MIHKASKGRKIRTTIKPTIPNTLYSMPEFPKDEPGVIYVRQSTIAQQQNNIHSFEMQTDKFVEYFREQMKCTGHIEIIADDEGISGTKDIHERAGLTRVIRLVEGKELLNGKRIRWIGAIHVNRLTRDIWLVTPGTIMKECYQNDVWVATLRMNFNFQDEYCRRVFMIEAEESARHLEWMKLVLGGGKLTASSNGYYDGRWIVPGYIVDRSDEKRKKYIPYEPHAEIVKWLFSRFFDLDGNFPALCREVAKKPYLLPAFESWVDAKTTSKFSGNKKETKGSRINEGPYKGCYRVTMHGLKSILTNPVYIGWWLPIGGGVVENNHPALIDQALFIYAHKRLSVHSLTGERQKPERVNRIGAGKGILKKVLFDDRDKPMYVHFGDDGQASFRYRSLESDGITTPIYRYSVDVPEYDQIFLEKLFERIKVLEKLDNWQDKLQARLTAKKQQQNEKKNMLKKQIDRATRQRAEIMDTLSDPDIPKSKQMKIEYANQAAGLESKIHQWELELAEPETEEDEEVTLYQIHSILPDIKEEWKHLSFDVRLRFVGALVQKAVLTPVAPSWCKLEVYWKNAIGNFVDRGYIRRSRANRSRWPEKEDAILRELYPNSDAAVILQALPGRTWQSIRVRACKLKITRAFKNEVNPTVIDEGRLKGSYSWTEEEDAIIQAMYTTARAEDILNLLPDRTWHSIVQRASKKFSFTRDLRVIKEQERRETERVTVSLTNNFGADWTSEEDSIVVKMYPEAAPAEILKMLPGRTWNGIQSRAYKLGVLRGQTQLSDSVKSAGRVRIQLSWTEEENAVLREMYPEDEPAEILKNLLPHRTWRSVRKQASTLKIARKHGKTPNSLLLTENETITLEDRQFEEENGLISTVKSVQWLE